MKCREFIDLVDGYLEAMLPEGRQHECEAHLQKCPYCADYLATYRATLELMKRALCTHPEAEVPGEVAERLIKALREAGGQA